MKRIIAVWLVFLMLIGGMIGVVKISTNANIVNNEIKNSKPKDTSDLVIDGTTVTMCGSATYGLVHLYNNGTLMVTAYDGTGSTGRLELHADTIIIEKGSKIDGAEKGYRGGNEYSSGEGPGGGGGTVFENHCGGGGGYGGKGGDGWPAQPGGNPYGDSSSYSIEMGSGGGSSFSIGGNGGGSILLEAKNITIDGIITVKGGDSVNGGAGSGGGVLLDAVNINISGSITASGGYSSSYGGGGGGGRVKIYYCAKNVSIGAISAYGGGSYGGGNGNSGTIFYDIKPQITSLVPLTGCYNSSITTIDIVATGEDDDNLAYDIDAYYGGSWHNLVIGEFVRIKRNYSASRFRFLRAQNFYARYF